MSVTILAKWDHRDPGTRRVYDRGEVVAREQLERWATSCGHRIGGIQTSAPAINNGVITMTVGTKCRCCHGQLDVKLVRRNPDKVVLRPLNFPIRGKCAAGGRR